MLRFVGIGARWAIGMHADPTASLWHPCEEAQASCDVQGDASGQMFARTENGPGTDGRTEAARVRTADRDGMGGKPDQSKFLHSDFRLPFWGDLSRP